MGALYLAVTGDRGLEQLWSSRPCCRTSPTRSTSRASATRRRSSCSCRTATWSRCSTPGLVGRRDLPRDGLRRGQRPARGLEPLRQEAGRVSRSTSRSTSSRSCAAASRYAHAFADLKLVHRDVSPPNVLLSYTGEVKLTDFGLASSTLKLEKTAPGIIYGKVSYMSPEQARGETLDGRTDIYAVGIVLWELLTGRQLFPQRGAATQDRSACANPERRSRRRRARRACRRSSTTSCCRRWPATSTLRYADCEEMRAALAGFLAQTAPTTDDAQRVAELSCRRSCSSERDRGRARATCAQRAARGRERQSARPSTRAVRRRRSAPQRRREPRRSSPTPSARRRGHADGGQRRRRAARPSDAIDRHAIIDGRYRVRRLIGEGGMGRVYEAEHVEIGKRVAIKILHAALHAAGRSWSSASAARRARRRSIGHPNIVDVTDSGTTADGAVYFVMEYLDGRRPRRSVIERRGRRSPSRARCSIARADLPRAGGGARGRRHPPRPQAGERLPRSTRDGDADFVKVLDFGIAKTTGGDDRARSGRLTSPGMAMGTPEYMAPEQAAGRPADARADVYAVGAILYEMLTGRPPYEGDNFMEILTRRRPRRRAARRAAAGCAARARAAGDAHAWRSRPTIGRSRWRRWRRSSGGSSGAAPTQEQPLAAHRSRAAQEDAVRGGGAGGDGGGGRA